MKTFEKWMTLSALVGACWLVTVPAHAKTENAPPVPSNAAAAPTPEHLVQLWTEQALAGNASAQTELATAYYEGKGVVQNDREALKWARMGADQKNPEAYLLMGVLYANGRGVSKDLVVARQWFQKGADGGNARSQYILAQMHQAGDGGPVDLKKAVHWYRTAAPTVDDAEVHRKLGELLLAPDTGVSNPAEGLQWLTKAAENGDAEAAFDLSVAHFEGKVIPKNDELAFHWTRRAAEGGYLMGMRNLGVCFIQGIGVKKDAAQAAVWMRRAAERGDARALWSLGDLHRAGNGVAQDGVLAYVFFSLSTQLGEDGAKSERDAQLKKLSFEQVAEGQDLAAAWRQGTPLPTASKTWK